MSQLSRGERQHRQLEAAVARVSSAIRRYMSAAAGHQHGGDCDQHAEAGRALLRDFGIEALRVIGYAAWRIGPGGGDVLSHVPGTESYAPPGQKASVYHVWLHCRGHIIDFTTYQMNLKAQQLDALAGGHTTVTWCPDFLLLPHVRAKSFKVVRQAGRPGVVYYEAHPELEPTHPPYVLDPEDLHRMRILLARPHMNVSGPNTPGRRTSDVEQ